MAPILQNDVDEVFQNSVLVSQTPVLRDVTTTANGTALRTKAQQALAANATYLAIPAPTATEVRSQTELLTKEVNGLIRLLLGQLDDISDT